MGGNSLDEIWEQREPWRNRWQQVRRDVEELTGDYPGFRFGVIAEGEGGIEAVPRAGYKGELRVVIRPDAGGIRAALDADAALRQDP